ncbi:MAG TPA: VOC family protein [Pyrinomonadaceae bacterium]|nr:VOC family protein [Pyrinomonadaceae bacterium]
MGIEIKSLCPLIQVFNMRRSLAFYRDVLGFEVVADSGGGDDASWAWLHRDGINLMLNDQYEPGQVPPECPPDRVKWHKDTCLYFECPDPDAAFEFLRSKNVVVDPPNNAPYGMRQLYLEDPDGYNLCFQRSVDDE